MSVPAADGFSLPTGPIRRFDTAHENKAKLWLVCHPRVPKTEANHREPTEERVISLISFALNGAQGWGF